ncbi:lipoprotein insertase outer membrane protein LolB [Halomonas halocynthiae]|uniref:lipoprotein insertase outer membrane protein LolB n=1 Tax=Halomonas halocynthiae TaxID=176290 RepID=UPI0004129729|nr:lipoprotein insertase outer membrane protein LolB [Halomonas halocynthiae]
MPFVSSPIATVTPRTAILRSFFATIAITAALALLSGCATTQPPSSAQERSADQWQAQQSRVQQLQDWELNGKVGLRTPDESTSANIDWRQTPYYFRILLSGPAGTGRSVLEGRDGRVSMSTSEGRFEAVSPEALMQEQMGWSLPVSDLTDWVRGLPAHDRPHHMTEDALGFPATLEQNGWSIDYRQWSNFNDLWLPSKLVMDYDDLRVTLVVTRWQSESDVSK